MSEALVRRHVDRGVATLTLDSPANRNALSTGLLAELSAGLAAVLADDAVRVVVLSHTGSVFCSGIDLRAAAGADPASQPVAAFPRVLRQLWEAPKPVLARVAGKARAGGLGLIAACDIALAAETADFAFTEVRIGVVPAVISALVLPRLLPRAAHELLLTGEVFGGPRAAAAGLVNAAVPLAELDAEVARYCAMLTAGAPGALAATKQLLRRAAGRSLASDLAELSALSARHFAGPEGQEGIAAFAAKRPPSWVPVD
ncbi:MAG: enoyl-CoA hydratase/isomerase family protein [Actinobacteria bacterium]|nr:enoyl-CoA hydratase/isomerase family protein [Actinomycetota bacterium]